ncbi:transposase family protein [Streptomyces sp. NPDC006134]|uniref:transposase family protein n=1 Tax=Streptomyces sp. NPDC006134 TaxID=3154467 RepID=UPI0033D5C1BA
MTQAGEAGHAGTRPPCTPWGRTARSLRTIARWPASRAGSRHRQTVHPREQNPRTQPRRSPTPLGGTPSRCTDCRKQARRVHGTYQRTLHERPLGFRRVVVRLRVRRYFCDRKSCSRATFVEQVPPGLSERYHRSSTGLTDWLWSIAIELGGRPAARLDASRSGSRSTGRRLSMSTRTVL